MRTNDTLNIGESTALLHPIFPRYLTCHEADVPRFAPLIPM